MFEPGGSRQQPEIRVEEIINKIGSTIGGVVTRLGGGGMKLLGLGVVILLALLWLAGGVYTVGPTAEEVKGKLEEAGAVVSVQ